MSYDVLTKSDYIFNLLPKKINTINDIKGKAKNNTGNKNK